MRRRDFVKLGAGAALGAGAGALLDGRGAAAAATFATRHLVTIILGSGARKRDVIGNPEHAPFQTAMVKEGTLFTEDYCETVSLPGCMATEILTGRSASSSSQRPLFPTWNEYVRKKTGARATDFWMLQSVSYYKGFTWDVKHFSKHPEYGIRYGATSLTMNKLFHPKCDLSPGQLVERFVEPGLGHSPTERKRIEAWIASVLTSKRDELPSTRTPVVEREVQMGDCQALHLAGDILKAFEPRMLTIQILGLADASDDHGYETYLRHIETTDELIGNLWRRIQSDPRLCATTSLLIRPDCGRDSEVNRYGRLGVSPGDEHAHSVWTLGLGPDFEKGRVVTERVERRDLAPTITYLMSGRSAEYASGRVRARMFATRRVAGVN